MQHEPTRIGTAELRRPPETYRTRREALLRRLDELGLDSESAEQWCRAWEALADATARDRRTPQFWVGSTRWILQHHDGAVERTPRMPVGRRKRRPRPSS